MSELCERLRGFFGVVDDWPAPGGARCNRLFSASSGVNAGQKGVGVMTMPAHRGRLFLARSRMTSAAWELLAEIRWLRVRLYSRDASETTGHVFSHIRHISILSTFTTNELRLARTRRRPTIKEMLGFLDEVKATPGRDCRDHWPALQPAEPMGSASWTSC